MNTKKNFEVIIIGGSYAGLSAAMALGRSLREVLIIDSGLPCNRQTPHSHNFITQDGVQPSVIAEKAKAQVLQYKTIKFVEDLAVDGKKSAQGFRVFTEKGEEFTAQKLIFATGVKDLMPAIKGISECWGISVIHCPYCHGYEVHHKKTAIMANGEKGMHLATLVANLTDDLTIITSGKADFDKEELEKLKRNNIEVIEKKVLEIEHENRYVKNVIFTDRSTTSFEAVYASVPFVQHSDIPASLGCTLNEQGYLEVDMMQKTTVEGVFACGDNTTRMRSVANAVAAGNTTGAVVNMELAQEQF
ncbi:NAD(P)/FAD-dependent oxidoreductase [Aquimarina spongiae]|uniref:Thioredoxin reductase n=1 Tax=Aquimarina spongiae TaxID=570521 RepID=A0A1M6CIH9_9FLAO|nr:NAD(P)/FAD-dependent oxidoreductase [Aquimarina spongiae]SHI60713.1 Thioredoxin reductase [Aquimarina spongiae]